MPRIFAWRASAPLPETMLSELGALLKAGSAIVYPTSTLYGLGASIHSEAGIRRVNLIKSRPAGMPISIMASASQIHDLCTVPDAAARVLGSGDTRVTAVLPAGRSAPGALVHEATLAVRLPCSPLTESLVRAVGPVTATSANPHGAATPPDVTSIADMLGDAVSLYIDSGRLDGKPTTLVDYTGSEPKIIRLGAASPSEVGAKNGR